jgi:hypothetical protein
MNIAKLAGIGHGEGSSCGAASLNNSGSPVCGLPIDGPLLHSLSCGYGGGWYYSHNAVNRTLTNILGEVYGQRYCTDDHAEIWSSFGVDPDRPRTTPTSDIPATGQPQRRHRDPNGIWTPDILVRSFPPIYCDTTIVCAHSSDVLAHGQTPGHAVANAETKKSKSYHHMFARGILHDTTDSPPSTSIANFYTTAFETGGRFGTGVLRLLRALALRRQTSLGQPNDRLTASGRYLYQSWIQRLSVTLHLSTARRICARAKRDHRARWPLPDRNLFSWIPFSSMPDVETSLNTP